MSYEKIISKYLCYEFRFASKHKKVNSGILRLLLIKDYHKPSLAWKRGAKESIRQPEKETLSDDHMRACVRTGVDGKIRSETSDNKNKLL